MSKLTDFWDSPRWHAYEEACQDAPGSRTARLRGAAWATRLVDLTRPTEALWAGVRGSYHATVNRLGREFQEWGGNTPFAERPGRYRSAIDDSGAGWFTRTAERVHLLDAGRVTRSDATWQLMGDWSEEGHGLWLAAFDDTAPPAGMDEWPSCVGYAYFILDGDGWSYYASAASLRKDINIALVWWALLALKARGVRYCEIGWQGEAQDEKGRNIEFFRRGWPGRDIPIQEAYGTE